MIRKSLLFSIFLSILWSLLISIRPFSISQHQWQDNIIRAEKFIFDTDSTIKNLILGSSLALRIQTDSLPNYYNLSLASHGIFDGLHILRLKKHLPLNVFIEINNINSRENQTFKEIIHSPIRNILKDNFSMFRSDKQPLAVILRIIELIPYRMMLGYNHSTNKKTEEKSSLFNEMLNGHKAKLSRQIDSLDMDKQFGTLSNHIQFLISKGVNVVFFEMPINPQLVELNKPIYIRERVQKEYPNCKFIPLPDNFEYYETADAVHLMSHEAELYTSYFRDESIKAVNK